MFTRHELNATLILVIIELISMVYTTLRSRLIWLSKAGQFNPAVLKNFYLL